MTMVMNVLSVSVSIQFCPAVFLDVVDFSLFNEYLSYKLYVTPYVREGSAEKY